MRSSRPALIVALGVFACSAQATDRYYDDQTVLSPNRKLRLEAKSPDNVKRPDGRRTPFAKNFTYRLFDNESGREIWSHRQGKDQGSPCAVFINDDGHVVIQGAWDDVQCLDPKSGKLIATTSMLKQLRNAERKKYVKETTAGPFWQHCSTWRFATLEGKPHFYIRSWWGRRLVIDLGSGRVSDGSRMGTALDRLDREFVIETLQMAVATMNKKTSDSCDDVSSDVRAALLMAGRLKIQDAAPLLKEIERSEHVTCASFGGWRVEGWPKDSLNPANFEEFGWRQAAQLALRRLGEQPQGLGCTRFRLETATDKRGSVVAIKSPFPDRAGGTEKIAAGMFAKDVLGILGAPDYVVQRRPDKSTKKSWFQCWEFDMDAAESFTLRVVWTNDGRVERTEVLKPALWRDGETRDFDIAW
ncbi:MAG: hypothetical protein IT450_17170 [Phycisphaerales bacterium]|nr:hypothetical protein [Phycisphaerales bacterium]